MSHLIAEETLAGGCLDNIVGINHACTPESPASGLYLQDLPFLTIKVADAASDEETSGGVELLREKLLFAHRGMINDLRSFIVPHMRLNSVLENDVAGYYQTNMSSVAAQAGYYKGIRARIDYHPFLSFYLNSFSIFLDASVTANLYVIDLLQDKILDTLQFTSVANEITQTVVNKEYFSHKQRMHLLFAIDAGVAGTFKSSVYKNFSSCHACGSGEAGNDYVIFSGVSLDQALASVDANTRGIGGTNGVSLNYSLNCHIEPLICNMASQLAWPLLHRWGAEVLREVQYSRRLNSIVTVHAKDVEALRKEFFDEYTSKMNDIIGNMKYPNDICFECRRRLRTAVQLP